MLLMPECAAHFSFDKAVEQPQAEEPDAQLPSVNTKTFREVISTEDPTSFYGITTFHDIKIPRSSNGMALFKLVSYTGYTSGAESTVKIVRVFFDCLSEKQVVDVDAYAGQRVYIATFVTTFGDARMVLEEMNANDKSLFALFYAFIDLQNYVYNPPTMLRTRNQTRTASP